MKPSEEARLNEVRRIGKDRASEAATTLDSAFREDNLFLWMRNDPKQSDLVWWETIIKNMPSFSEIHAMGDISAVSLWLPSDELSKQLAADAGINVEDEGMEAIEEVLKVSLEYFGEKTQIIIEMHELVPKQAHWYLASIGTLPEFFGKGRGTKLLEKMTQHLDTVGLPAYLEASSTKNAALYSRHGFEITQELNLMDAPTLYAMWREPR